MSRATPSGLNNPAIAQRPRALNLPGPGEHDRSSGPFHALNGTTPTPPCCLRLQETAPHCSHRRTRLAIRPTVTTDHTAFETEGPRHAGMVSALKPQYRGKRIVRWPHAALHGNAARVVFASPRVFWRIPHYRNRANRPAAATQLPARMAMATAMQNTTSSRRGP